MRQFKFKLAKVMIVLAVLFMVFPNGMVVQAEEVVAELITLEEAQDFTVMFTYEGEQPAITFLSPSGKEYAEGISSKTELIVKHGEGWSTYKVIMAEAGIWSVRCDKKNNEYVDYSFVEEIDGLCIQSFEVASISGDKATLSFLVTMGEEERIWYDYTITAIAGEDESAGKQLKSGSTRTGEACEITVKLDLSSYDNYRFLLEVTAKQGLEMFDSMVSEPFSYVNANTPVAMEDFYVKINTSNNTCEIDWDDFSMGWNKKYTLVAIADGDTENPIYTNTTSDEKDVFFYPTGTGKLTIQLYYKDDGVLSEPVMKEIDLVNGEMLQIVTPEVTAGTQLELAYKVEAPVIMEVRLNEESGQYNIEGAGSACFPLQEGVNTVQAGFVGGNNITYYVGADIYRDATPPVLSLYENLDGMTFQNGEAVISGAVKNAVKLTINGADVAVDDKGVFEYTIALAEGVNNVTIVASSVSGIGTSRSMQIMRESGGLVADTYRNYLPLLIALGVSVLIIIFALIFVRKKDKEAAKKSMTYKRFAVKLGILFFVLDAVSMAGYIYFYCFNNGRQYIEVVKESVAKASRYTDYERYCFMAMLVLSGVLLLNLLVGLVVRAICKKKATKAEVKKQENTTTGTMNN